MTSEVPLRDELVAGIDRTWEELSGPGAHWDARGELEEFAGVPDTNGEVFTVNCPVPVLAPNTFGA